MRNGGTTYEEIKSCNWSIGAWAVIAAVVSLNQVKQKRPRLGHS